jgi:hypothetical protein
MIEKMRNQNVVIYHHPNPEMKSFLISEEISAQRVEHFKRPLQKGLGEILEVSHQSLAGPKTVGFIIVPSIV